MDKLVIIWTNWLQYGQIGHNMDKLVMIWTNRDKIWTNMDTMVTISISSIFGAKK